MSSFSRPTAVAVRRALSLFSPVSPLPQNQQNFTISALTKREFLLLFSKSNAFSFLSETKRRRSCGGQGEPSWSIDQFTPCDRVRSPVRRYGQMVLSIWSVKRCREQPTLFPVQDGQDCAPKCAQACLRKNFRIAKILATQSSARKSQKSVPKSHFRMVKMADWI